MQNSETKKRIKMVVHEFIGLYICNAHLTIEFEQFESLLSEFYTSQGNVDACVNRASFSKTLCRGPYTATNLENRFSRAVAPFSRREARATILRAQDDLYQEFSGTYQKPLVLHCLPIQNGWYAGTLVQKFRYHVLQAYQSRLRLEKHSPRVL